MTVIKRWGLHKDNNGKPCSMPIPNSIERFVFATLRFKHDATALSAQWLFNADVLWATDDRGMAFCPKNAEFVLGNEK